MSAQEALQYGLIDEIVSPNEEKLQNLLTPPPNKVPTLLGAKKRRKINADDDEEDRDEEFEFGKLVSDSCSL